MKKMVENRSKTSHLDSTVSMSPLKGIQFRIATGKGSYYVQQIGVACKTRITHLQRGKQQVDSQKIRVHDGVSCNETGPYCLVVVYMFLTGEEHVMTCPVCQ